MVMMCAWCLSRSNSAVVSFSSANTLTHSPKARLVVTIGLAVAMVACQAATPKKTQVTVGTTVLPSVSFDAGATAAETVTITSAHFEGTNLKYTASSDKPTVATAKASGNVVTVTPIGAGTATVLVTATATASDEEGRASQSFTVTVTAPAPPTPEPDPDNNAPRLKAGRTLPHHTNLMYGGSATVDLDDYFTDDEDDPITYVATSNDVGVVTTSVSDSMLTITVVNHGETTVIVTATDDNNLSRKEAFDVVVINQAPMVVTAENTHLGPYPIGHMQPVDLDDFFMDVEGDTLTYTTPVSDDTMVATVTAPDADNMVTITAVADGEAMITITASDGVNSTDRVLTVTVSPAPVAPNNPPTRTSMTPSPVSLTIEDDETEMLDVSGYFMDADGDTLTYTAMSSNTGIATESIDGSMLTITAAGAGSATVTVTASDGNGGSETVEIMVTVNAPSNMAPRPKAGMTLPDLRIQITPRTDPATELLPTADDNLGEYQDNKTIDLSKYFEDPDGVLLFFKVTKTETPVTDDTTVIKLHSGPATYDATRTPAGAAPTGEGPDGTDDDDTTLVIDPQNPGTATVKVEVLDIWKKSYVTSFMVTVVAEGANTGPIVGSGSGTNIADQTAAGPTEANSRLKIGQSRKVIDDDLFSVHFTDTDFTKGDYLKISVKYFATGTITEGAANPTGDELAADKVGVSHTLSATTWDGNPNAKFTLTLTGEMGTTGHQVALIATDTFGQSRARVFEVRVNNPPKAEGAQASATPPMKVLTLTDASDELRFKDMGIDSTGTEDDENIVLVADNAGYFHDPDGDNLVCRITGTSGDDYATFVLAANTHTVTVTPVKIGPASVTLACVDTYDEHSPEAILNVNVTHRDVSRQ